MSWDIWSWYCKSSGTVVASSEMDALGYLVLVLFVLGHSLLDPNVLEGMLCQFNPSVATAPPWASG